MHQGSHRRASFPNFTWKVQTWGFDEVLEVGPEAPLRSADAVAVDGSRRDAVEREGERFLRIEGRVAALTQLTSVDEVE